MARYAHTLKNVLARAGEHGQETGEEKTRKRRQGGSGKKSIKRSKNKEVREGDVLGENEGRNEERKEGV